MAILPFSVFGPSVGKTSRLSLVFTRLVSSHPIDWDSVTPTMASADSCSVILHVAMLDADSLAKTGKPNRSP
ncbi:MAG: hypothetical protein Q8P12_03455, partial [bacterium]|nr:hypothetical protein [bacterium]